MTETPEEPVNELERIQTALVAFTGCVGEAVDDICSYGLTIGQEYVPFDPDPEDECDDEEAMCSQMWVRVTDITPRAVGNGWGGDTCAVSLTLGLEVGVLRCFDITEEGEAPSATEVLAGALQAVEDMNNIQCAALGCEVWDSITLGQWTPSGPLGGQYGGVWTMSVDL